jgi:hypothetical protein
MSSSQHSTDVLGVTIEPTDRVTVTSYGSGARLVDCGTQSIIRKFGRVRLVINDCDGNARAVHPRSLAVLRRDGESGLEGNLGR